MRERMMCVAAGLCASVGWATVPAHAEIISVNGQATLIARPGDAQLGVLTGNTTAFVWNEAQQVQISTPVTIDGVSPGLYASSLDFNFVDVAAGSIVNSHFVHFDTVGGSSHAVDGSITLSADILGVIAWNRQGSRHMDDSDAAFGLGTLFSTGLNRRGVFDSEDGSPPQEDAFTISADHRTLSFHLEVSSPYDEIRVLTAVPEPGALTALALIGIGFVRRRR